MPWKQKVPIKKKQQLIIQWLRTKTAHSLALSEKSQARNNTKFKRNSQYKTEHRAVPKKMSVHKRKEEKREVWCWASSRQIHSWLKLESNFINRTCLSAVDRAHLSVSYLGTKQARLIREDGCQFFQCRP